MTEEYCPNCVVELKPIHKKLDESPVRNWMRCPDCGFTKRPVTTTEIQNEVNNFELAHDLKSTHYRVILNKYF